MVLDSDPLKYGALGFGVLVLFLLAWLIVRPLVAELRENRRGLVEALKADREERVEQRKLFMGYMENHAAAQVAAMGEVKEGLREVVAVLRGLNGREGD